MKLKKLYDANLKVNGIKVLNASPRWNVSPKLVNAGIADGWISTGGGKITINAVNGDFVYNILRGPGRYDDVGQINHFETVKE